MNRAGGGYRWAVEHTGVTPAGGVVAADLEPLLTGHEPVATVYLTTAAAVENAAPRSELRWKALREELAAAGADEAALGAIDPLVPDAHRRGECLAAVAGARGVLLSEHHPDPPRRDVARWAELPSLIPVVEWRQSSPAHLVVLIDRTGADLIVTGDGVVDRIAEIEGDDRVKKPKPGGWSQRRYQQRAENNWEHNAREVAEHVVRLVDRVEPRVVVVAGDVRAVQLLRADLPGRVDELIEVIDGARSPGASTDAEAEAITRVVASAVAEDTTTLVRKLREELGQHDRAVEGAPATLAALARGQVEVLLVHDDPDDERTAWFGPEPTHVAATPDDLGAMGVETPRQARLVDVALRGAVCTGAAVRVVPGAGPPAQHIGAILRWSS